MASRTETQYSKKNIRDMFVLPYTVSCVLPASVLPPAAPSTNASVIRSLPSAFILSFGNNNRHVLSEQPCGHSSSPCLLLLPTLLLQATARAEQKPGAHQRLRQNSAYGVNAPYSPALACQRPPSTLSQPLRSLSHLPWLVPPVWLHRAAPT